MQPKVLRRCHQNHAISPFFRRNFSDHGRKQGFKTSNLRESITWPVTAPPDRGYGASKMQVAHYNRLEST